MVTNNFICVHHGTYYDTEYVSRLYRGVKKFTKQNFKFYVLTDDPKKFQPNLNWNFIQLPTWPGRVKGWWYKMEMFNPLIGLKGNNLYMDLDVVIIDNIDCFWNYKTDTFSMCHDFNKAFHKHIQLSNSSIMRWNDNDMMWLYEKFSENKNEIIRRYRGDQDFIQLETTGKHVWFPDEWAMSWKWETYKGGKLYSHKEKYKSTDPYVIHPDTKVLVFHGDPKPHEVPEVQHLWY